MLGRCLEEGNPSKESKNKIRRLSTSGAKRSYPTMKLLLPSGNGVGVGVVCFKAIERTRKKVQPKDIHVKINIYAKISVNSI